MAHRVMINGAARDITGGKTMVAGAVVEVKNGRTRINGAGYDIPFATGTPISDLPVGSSVFMNVNGVRKEFLIVHKGLPGSMYDASCNGNWLLMKDIYEIRLWHSAYNNDYENSPIHSYLNSTFLGLFDANIQAQLKQVKIPYRPGSGNSLNVNSGADGLSAKIFLLSGTEVSIAESGYIPVMGAELDYFKGCQDTANDAKRVAKLNGSAHTWWLRSPLCAGPPLAVTVIQYGGRGSSSPNSGNAGTRPALVLPNDAAVDENFNVIG